MIMEGPNAMCAVDHLTISTVISTKTFVILTSMCLTSPLHSQPSLELGHATTRESTSRFIKLSRNSYNVTWIRC